MRKFKIKHSKGSYAYALEIRLKEMVDEQAEFELMIELEKEKIINALLTKEEMIILRDTITESLDYEKETSKTTEKEQIPFPKKLAQKQFNEDYIQQKDSEPIEDDILDHTKGRMMR